MPRCSLKDCRKKSSIVFKCRCKSEFCAKHRYPEEHKCPEMESFKKPVELPKIVYDSLIDRI